MVDPCNDLGDHWCIRIELPIFVVLIPRVIHDVTAFVFYIAHDHNRNLGVSQNAFYALFRPSKIPTYVVGLLVAIVIANVFTEMPGLGYGASIVLGLLFFHYYSEGIIWKRKSIDRRFVFVQIGASMG